MPRSPIRRPDPQLDLSRWLLACDDLPSVLSSQTLFGNDRPLEIEIGSGKGLFLSTVSVAETSRNYVGVEIAAKYAEHAASRLAKAEVPNARMICGNAEPLFSQRVLPGSLEAVHVYFPDPWWKARHRKRRVVNPESAVSISAALRPGGRFHFWTDVLDYFEVTVEMLAEITPELGVPIPEEERQADHDLDYRTHFERRSRRHGIPVYRVCYTKRCGENG